MQLKLFESEAAIAAAVSGILIRQVQTKPASVLGFATGSSPVKTYDAMVQAYQNGLVSFRDVVTFNLDEYCGLSKTDETSYYAFMQSHLFGRADFQKKNIHFLDGNAVHAEAACAAYRCEIAAAGGIDIQLLGIGTNGHIGFNEPSDSFSDGPFQVHLAQSTKNANGKYFKDGAMPDTALTMGIGDILRTRKLLLIATGESKAKAIRAMVKGEVTPLCPASVLQTHSDVTVFLDAQSASLLAEEDLWQRN
ncbi:MAG: glucosamine-6-phosphate deaminase [Clostridia bacterium]|nr:glucosamine-6-phosphate deaminase [Clostridia bacterium]